MQIDLLHSEDGIKDFCALMAKLRDDKLLSLKVQGVLINVIWDLVYPRIVKFVFLPFMINFICFVFFISFCYDPDAKKQSFAYILLPYPFIFSILQLCFEVKQFREEGRSYYADITVIWNIFDVASSSLVIAFSTVIFLEKDRANSTVVMGCLAVFFLWFKQFYFLRLFKPTASFIRMIIEMFLDIKIFLVIFFTGILAFSNAYYILDFASREDLYGNVLDV